MKLSSLGGFVGGAALGLFAVISQTRLVADQIQVHGFAAGYDGRWYVTDTNNTGTVSEANAGVYRSIKGSASFGRIDIDLTAIGPAYGLGGTYASEDGYWSDTITILPDNPALLGAPGTAVFTYHVSGSQSQTPVSGSLNNSYFLSNECGCGGPQGKDLGDPNYSGPRLSDLTNYTVLRGFTFGVPFSYSMDLSCVVSVPSAVPSGDNPAGTLHASVAAGGITALDATGNSVAYSSTASAGSGRAWIVPDGASYAGFSVTNNLNQHTVLSLLGGTNSSGTNETVAATFLTSPDTNRIISDVVDLSSSALTNLNKLVVQMSYDPVQAIASFGSETNALLVWFKQSAGKFVNAVDGNSDGGLAQQFFLGAFNLATQFQLGNRGVDTTKHVAWAVVDHHSQFAVGVVTPPLQFNGIFVGTNGASLSLTGPAGGQYLVEKTSDSSLGGWSVLSLITLGTNGIGTFDDAAPVAGNPQRFYRARQ